MEDLLRPVVSLNICKGLQPLEGKNSGHFFAIKRRKVIKFRVLILCLL